MKIALRQRHDEQVLPELNKNFMSRSWTEYWLSTGPKITGAILADNF
jgi:hypothetical protein